MGGGGGGGGKCLKLVITWIAWETVYKCFYISIIRCKMYNLSTIKNEKNHAAEQLFVGWLFQPFVCLKCFLPLGIWFPSCHLY